MRGRTGEPSLITLGHCSDLHATDPIDAEWGALYNKRFLGWVSWKLNRRKLYQPRVLEALIEDLQAQAPDHVAITGDLTNISLESEFVAAARVLERMGGPDWISVIAGNHDAYIDLPFDRSWEHWASYMASDPEADSDPVAAARKGELGKSDMFAFRDAGPSLRIRGELALVGVSTAIPTPALFATGMVGEPQLARLESLLRELGERGLCRVVLVHHPLLPANDSKRRGIDDAQALRDVLERAGADLVLHGHDHKTILGHLDGREGAIPVVGIRSGSYEGPRADKNAHYHLYRIESPGTSAAGLGRYSITLTSRAWDGSRGCFTELESGRPLSRR